jgi:hypothetical protein
MSPSADALVVDAVADAAVDAVVDTAALELPICGMCLHPLESHDAIATRYCAASASSALARGCVCRPADGADSTAAQA